LHDGRHDYLLAMCDAAAVLNSVLRFVLAWHMEGTKARYGKALPLECCVMEVRE
jgi:hypothetical protein